MARYASTEGTTKNQEHRGDSTATSTDVPMRRRQIHVIGLSLACMSLNRTGASYSVPVGEDFEEYRGSVYSIRYPGSWEVSSKAGADVVFKSTGVTLGITILPVRISRVQDYGNVNEVADKIVQTERAKDGTLDARIIEASSVALGNGTIAYDYEYQVQSTRGTKLIVSRVCIQDKQLYVVNGTISCGKVDVCDISGVSDLLDRAKASVSSFAFTPSL